MDVDDRAQLLQLDDDAKMLDDVRTADTGDDYDDVMRLSRSPSPCSSSTSDSPLSSESPDPGGLKSAQLEEQDGQRGEDDGDDQLLDDGNEFDRFLSRSSSANLNKRIIAIFEAPEFVQRLKSYIEAELGDTVTFSAEYRAVPRPTVKWFKDEEEVRPTERHHLDESVDSDGVIRLRISDVIATDEGAYKCKVENREGVASTTGYLSVAGKPSRRPRSSRTSGKLAGCSDKTHGGVSTPPILGPIVEQKSMEEKEERELQRQPPSPLQDFIDSIRRSAKAKHAPIFYGTADIFTVQDDGEECTASEDDLTTSEDEVFGADDTGSYTPTGTPDILLDSDPDLLLDFDGDSSSTPDTPPICLCAVDNFKSPEISYNSMDSTAESPLIANRLSESVSVQLTADILQDSRDACCKSESTHFVDAKHPVTREFQRTRLGQLQLQHRLAIDLPDSPPPTSSSSPPDSISTEHATDTEPSDSLCSTVTIKRSLASPNMELLASQSAGLDISDVVDGLVCSLDCPDVQFYVVFIASSALVAAACQVSPVWLVLIVSAVSILRFCLQTRRTKL